MQTNKPVVCPTCAASAIAKGFADPGRRCRDCRATQPRRAGLTAPIILRQVRTMMTIAFRRNPA